MSAGVWIANGVSWFVQALLLSGVVGALLAVLRIHEPRFRLLAWQASLLTILVSPLFLSWQPQAQGGAGVEPALPAAEFPWGWLLSAVLVVGVIARVVWLGVGVFRLIRLRREAESWHPSWLDRLAARIGASASLATSADVRGAVTFGYRRPWILVSRALMRDAAGRQHAVVAHELLHVARGDWLWVIAEEATRSVLWWQPAIWLAVNEIRQAREELVDREAIEATNDRDSYLEALLAAAEHSSAAAGGFAPHFFRRHQLKSRIRRLLKENDMSPIRMHLGAAVIALALPVTAWASGEAFPLVSPGVLAIEQEPPPPPPPGPVVVRPSSQLPPPPPAPPPPAKARRVVRRAATDAPPAPPVFTREARSAPVSPPPPPPPMVAREVRPAPPAPPAPPARVRRVSPGPTARPVAPAPERPVRRSVGDAPPAPPVPPPPPPRVVRKSVREMPPPPPPPPAPPKRGRGGR